MPVGAVRSTFGVSRRREMKTCAASRRPRGPERRRSEGTRSEAQGRMWERAVLPTFPKQKSRTPYRRKGPAASPHRTDKPPAEPQR